jgi:hypothetical protein
LIAGFPLLVAVFAWNGLPAVKNLSMGLDLNMIEQMNEAKDFLIQSTKVGSLVSGIVMFQVILLTLMGANNSGREIAAERGILEKEKLSGLSPLASHRVEGGVFIDPGPRPVALDGMVRAPCLWIPRRPQWPTSAAGARECGDDIDLSRHFQPHAITRAGLAGIHLPRGVPTSAFRGRACPSRMAGRSRHDHSSPPTGVGRGF